MFSNAASTGEQISGSVVSARSVLDAEGTRVNEEVAVTAIGVLCQEIPFQEPEMVAAERASSYRRQELPGVCQCEGA